MLSPSELFTRISHIISCSSATTIFRQSPGACFWDFSCNFPENADLPENSWCRISLSSPVLCFLLQLHSDPCTTETSERQPTGSFLPVCSTRDKGFFCWYASSSSGLVICDFFLFFPYQAEGQGQMRSAMTLPGPGRWSDREEALLLALSCTW